MRRDPDRLTGRTFDLLVVGGGIHGLTIACDGAQRGLSVALIEGADFGAGSSFNHLRTIHGGLRYLQTLDLVRARESVGERRTLARIAPHAVRPLPFVLPLFRSIARGRLAMSAGLLLDRLVAFDRNDGVRASHRLPAPRIESRDAAVRRHPELRRPGLTGAAVWFDYVTIEADRLTFAWALAADAAGAVLANHVEARTPLLEGGRVAGMQATDLIGRRDLAIHARLTINATGGAIDRLIQPRGPRLPLLQAMNLVTRREAGGEALGGRSASGRHLFLVPWRGRALFGTWESGSPASAGNADLDEQEVAAFIAELNQAFPSLDLTRADVTLVHRGIVPAVVRRGQMTLEGHEKVRTDVEGAIGIAGAKYTTARRVAERIVDLAGARLGRTLFPCRTASTPLPGGDMLDPASALAEEARREADTPLPGDCLPHLIDAYGTLYRDVLAIARQRPEWRVRLDPGSPVIAAQLVWAARHEMAITLADATIRRTPLGALGCPGDRALEQAARILGEELGWNTDTQRAEIAAVRRFYETRGSG
ncbi:MAG: FAD-dependent oxidoreductase [Acidobacteria bacterium]|nr:FAD-dependent oxidoreductase [Acidobacteriota bacterium]